MFPISFPSGYGFAVVKGPPTKFDGFHPEEIAIAERFGEKRRSDFLLGRHAARQALAQISDSLEPILRGDRGEPLFPRGFVGSISHKDGTAVAIAALQKIAPGLGVDLEYVSPRFSVKLLERISSSTEQQTIPALKESKIERTFLFAAKESIFKALDPSSRSPTSWSQIEISCTGILTEDSSISFQSSWQSVDLQGRAFLSEHWIMAFAAVLQ